MLRTLPQPDGEAASAAAPAFVVARVGPVRLALLAAWALASFGTCYLARGFQDEAGGALAYSLAAQGVLIVFIVLVVVNAAVFNRQPAGEEAADAGMPPGG